jgi:hypothetical protein
LPDEELPAAPVTETWLALVPEQAASVVAEQTTPSTITKDVAAVGIDAKGSSAVNTAMDAFKGKKSG